MTLIVAMANDSIAVLVADRRITQGQIVLDDEFNKVTVLVCKDARLSAAFTGLATYNDFNTSEWIANTLHQICEQTPEIHSIIVALEDGLGSNDGSGSAILNGRVFYRNFAQGIYPQSPYRQCWYIYSGPYACYSSVMAAKSSSTAIDGFTLLGSFSGVQSFKAFQQ